MGKEWMEDNGPVSAKKRKLLNMRELKTLREICFEPQTWLTYQEESVDAVRQSMGSFAPLLSVFFWKMHGCIKEAQKILSYEVSESTEQQRAIQMVDNLPPPMIEYKDADDDEKDGD